MGDKENVSGSVALISQDLDISRQVAALRAWWQGAVRTEIAVHARLEGELHRLRGLWRGAAAHFDAGSIEVLRTLSGELGDARRSAEAASRPTLESARTVLHEVFGYQSFRPGQAELIEAVLAGRDAVGVMPTGAGKSLTYQIPARLLGGATLVVSPLIALMKDQVDAASEVGLRATVLNSTISSDQRQERVAGLRSGRYELVYAAPEGIETWLGAVLDRARLSLVAVDEAHCISHWGHEFRPSYRNLARLKRRFGDIPVLALTATATHAVTDDIAEQLGMRKPFVYRGSFFRSNLELHAYKKGETLGAVRQALLALVRGRPSESGIVYCMSRKSTERTAEFLSSKGIRAAAYHAGLDARTRTTVQDAFVRDDIEVVAATVAFGMGIDKSNIRYVVHRDMPRSIEGYYQEVGRAGRDGVPSACVLFYSWADVLGYDRLAEESSDSEEARRQRAQARQMFAMADQRACRHQSIARHLGEQMGSCGTSCDICSGRDLLAGLSAERTAGGRKRSPREHLPTARAGFNAGAEISAEDDALFSNLKTLRKRLADGRGVPAYVVFSDATLRAMVAERPRSLEALRRVHGVGPKKLVEYGESFLKLLAANR